MSELVMKVECVTCREVIPFYHVVYGYLRDPKPGDYTVCYHCGEFLTYTHEMNLRRMELLEELNMDSGVWCLMAGLRLVVLRRNG